MPTPGLTNVYLKIGLGLVLLGVLCGAGAWSLGPAVSEGKSMLLWVARAGVLGGIVIYLIGRFTGTRRNGPAS